MGCLVLVNTNIRLTHNTYKYTIRASIKFYKLRRETCRTLVLCFARFFSRGSRLNRTVATTVELHLTRARIAVLRTSDEWP